MVECKTADPRTRLEQAKPEHVYQAQVQLGLLRELTPHRPNFALISYTDASFWDNVLEFVVAFDPAIFATAKERARNIMLARSAAELSPEGWVAGGSECKYCPFTTACGRARTGKTAGVDPQFVAEVGDLARANGRGGSTFLGLGRSATGSKSGRRRNPARPPDLGERRSKMASEVAIATANFFEKYGEAATARNITGRLLRFNKFGEYRAGQDEQEIPRGTALVAYMTSLSVGYVRWEDARPAEIIMGPVGEGFAPPRREELGHTDQARWETFDDGRPRDPWQLSNSLVLLELEFERVLHVQLEQQGRARRRRRTQQDFRQAHSAEAGRNADYRVGRRTAGRAANQQRASRRLHCRNPSRRPGRLTAPAAQTAAAAAKKIPASKPATRL